MKRLIAAVLLSWSAAGARAEAGVIDKFLRFAAPKGWTRVEYANAGGADAVLRFENLADSVQLRLFGAPGSDYATPKAFLAGPAGTTNGAAASIEGEVEIAGQKRTLRRRKFAVNLPDPHGPPAPIMMGSELFAILPLDGKRFVVLSYRRESPIPDVDKAGEKAWAAFLKSIKTRKRR